MPDCSVPCHLQNLAQLNGVHAIWQPVVLSMTGGSVCSVSPLGGDPTQSGYTINWKAVSTCAFADVVSAEGCAQEESDMGRTVRFYL